MRWGLQADATVPAGMPVRQETRAATVRGP
jgi:hypothetical protein